MKTQEKASRDELLARAAQEGATPEESLTPEQSKRKRDREKKRKERDSKRKEKAASTARDEREWWNGNRETLKPEELAAMQAQHERVHDLLDWMELCGHENEGLDFVSVEEITADVVAFVKEHGVVHLGAITKNEIPANWCTRKYWRDAALLEKLENENRQTAQYVLYGLLAAVPDWRVVQFLTEKAGWTWQKAADLVGYYLEHLNFVRHLSWFSLKWRSDVLR
jgi:hypothetical protein